MSKPERNIMRPRFREISYSGILIHAIKTIAKGNEQFYGDAITVLSEIQMGQHQRRVREEAYNAIDFLNED